ncbi:MAG: hypothetical protein L6455_11495 [Kiritimatiellae bacterium]|nr:hypothetical protein [Kiritimatiellia bacterium]
MVETISILSALLISSLCGTWALLLKWIESKKTITDLKKENLRLQACITETTRQQIEKTNQREKEMAQIKQENNEFRARKAETEAKHLRQKRPKQTFVGYEGTFHKAKPIFKTEPT